MNSGLYPWSTLLRKTTIITTFSFPTEEGSVCIRKKQINVNSTGEDLNASLMQHSQWLQYGKDWRLCHTFTSHTYKQYFSVIHHVFDDTSRKIAENPTGSAHFGIISIDCSHYMSNKNICQEKGVLRYYSELFNGMQLITA